MRILCVIDSLSAGGAQRQLVELAFGFKENGHEIYFLTYHQSSFYDSILKKSGISIVCIEELNYVKRLLKIRHFIRHGHYDVVLSFLGAANFICEISGFPFRKWKLVVGERSTNPNILKSVKLKSYRLFHFFADYIVANSYANIKLVKSINSFLPNSKFKVIYNLVDLSRWQPLDDFTFKKNGKIKLIVAAGHRYLKNLNGLVEAIILLPPTERNMLSIEWYGDILDDSLTGAKIKITDYGLENVITFHPATHEITKIFQEADVVGLFSFYEGFPNAICEGMACGKPVICSHVSDMPQFLSKYKRLLCNPDEPQSICNAISYILSLSADELMNIGASNRTCAEMNFARENILSKYLELFKSK
jgi:glycosyltransferase involved in cell wall biosynthesis